MITKESLDNLLVVILGMLLFKSTTYMDSIEFYIKDYKYYVFIATLIIFFNRRWLLNKIYGG